MITPETLVSELNNTITELLLLKSRLETYSDGPPLSINEIEEIEKDFEAVMHLVPEMIDIVALTKPNPAILGDRLKDCFVIPTEILELLIELRKKAF